MNVSIQPATLGGEFWVDVSMDGETSRHGPYADSDEAEVAAVRLAAVCRAHECRSGHGRTGGKVAPMSDVITLNGIEVELGSDAARAFISDACRAGEFVIDDATLMENMIL